MNTDDLIKSLGSELTPVSPGYLTRGMAQGLGAGLGVTVLAFVLFWGMRTDPARILGDVALLAKSVLPLALACLALMWLLAQARPAGRSRAPWIIWAVPAGLAVLVAMTLLGSLPASWPMALQGKSITTCLVSIPILSVPVLAGLLAALRRGAPEHPARCGAVAGLAAGATAATVYSIYCIEGSPLFYGTWYTLAILGVCAAGAAAGHLLLRW